MFGKFFASTYTGSMYGAGPSVFAVWAYCIATCNRGGLVDLNVQHLAHTIGASEAEIQTAIAYLAAPDPKSRSKAEGGARLVQRGEYRYWIVNYEFYRAKRDAEERREYNREAQQRSRARRASNSLSTGSGESNSLSTPSAAVSHGEPRQRQRQKQKQSIQVEGDLSGSPAAAVRGERGEAAAATENTRQGVTFPDPTHTEAHQRLLEAHASPRSWEACVSMALQLGHPPEIVGQAVFDIAAAGAQPSRLVLDNFIARLKRPPTDAKSQRDKLLAWANEE